MAEAPPPAMRNNARIWELVVGEAANVWARTLVRKHLEARSRLALFQSSKGGRDAIQADALACTVRIVDLLSDEVSVRRLSAIKKAVHTRGGLSTKLQVQWAAAEDSAVREKLSYVLGALAEGSQRLTELQLGGRASHATTLSASLLAAVARSCAHLQTLVIRCRVDAMPQPQLFPHLTRLTIIGYTGSQAALDRLLPTISPYLAQLTAFVLKYTDQDRTAYVLHAASWPRLLPPTLRANHLRQLSIDIKLDDTLLGLLLFSAPALEVLHVRQVSLLDDTHAQSTVHWRELSCNGLSLSSLPKLPNAPVGMKLVVRDLGCDVVEAQDEAAVLQALERMVLVMKGQPISIQPGRNVSVGQPAALRLGLKVARLFAAPPPGNAARMLWLSKWTMSAPLMLELRQAPPYETLSLQKCTWLPEPLLYSTLLRLLPSSYSRVEVYPGPSSEVFRSICLGAPLTHTADDPFHIKLAALPNVILSIQQCMQQLGVFPGVVVGPL